MLDIMSILPDSTLASSILLNMSMTPVSLVQSPFVSMQSMPNFDAEWRPDSNAVEPDTRMCYCQVKITNPSGCIKYSNCCINYSNCSTSCRQNKFAFVSLDNLVSRIALFAVLFKVMHYTFRLFLNYHPAFKTLVCWLFYRNVINWL